MPCSDHRSTVTEAGGTELGVGTVADGEFLKRVGDEVVGASAGGVTDHGALTGLGDDDHTQYQLRTEKGAALGYAGLNGSSLVVQNPANATSTPTASKIPIADGNGRLNSWVFYAPTGLITQWAGHSG